MPTRACSGGKVWQTCGTACPQTCANPRNAWDACTQNCVVGCACKQDSAVYLDEATDTCERTCTYEQQTVVATFDGTAGVKGTITLSQDSPSSPTSVRVDLAGLNPDFGPFPWHVHVDPVSGGCDTAGGHYQPSGLPDMWELSTRHQDLSATSSVQVQFSDTKLSLFGSNSVAGRSIVLHKSVALKKTRMVCASLLDPAASVTAPAKPGSRAPTAGSSAPTPTPTTEEEPKSDPKDDGVLRSGGGASTTLHDIDQVQAFGIHHVVMIGAAILFVVIVLLVVRWKCSRTQGKLFDEIERSSMNSTAQLFSDTHLEMHDTGRTSEDARA